MSNKLNDAMIARFESFRANTPESSAAQGAMRELAYELEGVIQDVESGNYACDSICMDTIKRVRNALLQPSDATAQPSHIPAHAKKIGTDTYGWQGSGASNESMQELMENVAAHPSVDDLPYDEKGDVLRFSRFFPKPSVDISAEEILEIAGDFICDAAGKSNVLFFARRLLANTAQGKPEHIELDAARFNALRELATLGDGANEIMVQAEKLAALPNEERSPTAEDFNAVADAIRAALAAKKG